MSIPVCGSNGQVDALALLYSAAISGMNDALQPSCGKGAIGHAAADNHFPNPFPEAIALRIVSLSSALYGTYREHNKLGDTAASREQFAGVIGKGVVKGLENMQPVLDGLKAGNAEVAAGVDRTLELVMKGINDFATMEWSQPGGPTPLPDPV